MIQSQRSKMLTIHSFVLTATLLILVTTSFGVGTAHSASPTPIASKGVWGTKPVLAYFVLNPDFEDRIKEDLQLTEAQFSTVGAIAIKESERLRDLHVASESIVQDQHLSPASKRTQIEMSGYNDHVLSTVHNSQARLQAELGPHLYASLAAWIEEQWTLAKEEQSMARIASNDRTYTVFATQYGAYTNYEVAIPDKCLKFANLGWSLAGCPAGAYAYGKKYAVKISRPGYTVDRAPVLDVGPWNVDDTYWAINSDPQYRRRFTDLPLGTPAAQAAYFDNYINGKDQFGRMVRNPAGIDLSDGVRRELGLKYLENAWVQVTFLWTDGAIFLPLVQQ